MLTKPSSTAANAANLPASAGKAFGVQNPDPIPPESQTSTKENEQEEEEPTRGKEKSARRTSSRKVKKVPSPAAGQSSDSDDSEDEAEPFIQSDIDKVEDGTTEFTSVYWNGVPPVPKGTIAKRFAVATQDNQFANASDLLEISEAGKVSVKLQPSNWTPFLLTVPGAFRKVRVVYGAAVVKADQDRTQPYDRLMVLHGEYIPGVSYPKALELPMKALSASSIKFPTGADFGAKRKDQKCNKEKTWFVSSKVKKIAYLPFLIPVPPCLVFDAFQKDIDALVVYERWMVMREQTNQHYQTLDTTIRSFLKAQVVTPSARHLQGRLDIDIFLAGAPEGAEEWTREHIMRLVPTTETRTATPMAAASVQEFATAFVSAQHQLESDKKGNGDTGLTHSIKERTPQEESVATLGLSRSAYDRLLGMCGLVAGEDNLLPPLWKQLSEKLNTSTDKKVVVRTYVDNNIKYRESKLVLYHHLVQMIIKRDFEEETSMSCLRSAVKGLTPFAVPYLTDDEANRINEQAQALEQATSTTIKDVTTASIKLTVPANSEELTKRLKRFVNLLFVCFGESCPLLRQVDYLVADLEDYSDYARLGMSKRTVASTLWLVHAQSRYFARGYMNQNSGRDETLPTFDVMSKCIMNRLPFVNGDVPPVLYAPPPVYRKQELTNDVAPSGGRGGKGERKRSGGNSDDRENKRARIVQNPNYHHYIKAKMAEIVGNGRRLPRVSLLCLKAGTRAGDIFPGKENLCIKATLYGTCFENCSREHSLVTDPEAKAAMTKLQKVIEDPTLVKVNNF